jgi:hypothetical protein
MVLRYALLIWVFVLVGCQSAQNVAKLGEIVDPTGVKSAVEVGDHSVEVQMDMGKPDDTLISKSKRTDAMVYRRSGAEGVVLLNHDTKRVVRVLTADKGWMSQERLESLERELGST